MPNAQRVLWLAAGIAVGVAATLVTDPQHASAQRIREIGGWVMEAVPGSVPNAPSAAWRINTITGHLEVCEGALKQPKCASMPAPTLQ
jgi:hypothetical protein